MGTLDRRSRQPAGDSVWGQGVCSPSFVAAFTQVLIKTLFLDNCRDCRNVKPLTAFALLCYLHTTKVLLLRFCFRSSILCWGSVPP